jgi:hypothetical protein
LHGLSIDYDKTVNDLFSLEPTVMKYNWGNRGSGLFNENYIDHGRRNPTFRPFNEVCHSIGWWGHRDRYTGYDFNDERIKDKNSSLEADRMVPRNYLIDLTNDINQVKQFEYFQSFGHKHSGHALLYATYLAKQGTNPRKVIIIIGNEFDETWGGDLNNSTRGVTKKLLKDYKLCDKIRSGFKQYDPSVQRVDIYFVNLYNNIAALEANQFWGENCVGSENVFYLLNADDITRLKNVIRVGKDSGNLGRTIRWSKASYVSSTEE